jgi:preprotein translocase subunit YajC
LVRRQHAATLRQLVNDSRLARSAGWPDTATAGLRPLRQSRKEAPAMGIMHLAASSNSSSGSFTPILIIAVLFGVFYFLIIRPQRNRQRRAQQMQGGVAPGQRVRTTAGIYGTVISVDDTDVQLEIAPGVQIRVMRRAIMDILPEDNPADATPPPPEPGAGDPPAGDWDQPKDDWDSTDRKP